VDDGSPDNCPQICDAWAAKDSRIRVIHQQNAGPSVARNIGLTRSTGEYVLFVDSDDYFESSDAVSLIVKKAQTENSEIVCFNYKRFYEEKKVLSAKLCSLAKSNGSAEALVNSGVYTASPCLKLLRRELLQGAGLRFEEGVRSEDVEFSAKLLLLTDRISFCDKAVYVYRSHEGSATRTIGQKHIGDICSILTRMSQAKTDSAAYWNYTAFQYCTLLINLHFAKIPSEWKRQIFQLKWLLRYDGDPRVRLIRLVSSVLGVACTSRLLFWYFRLSE